MRKLKHQEITYQFYAKCSYQLLHFLLRASWRGRRSKFCHLYCVAYTSFVSPLVTYCFIFSICTVKDVKSLPNKVMR